MQKPESEVFDVPGANVEVTPESPSTDAHKAKAKKEITVERKQQLLEQLKRGRETAAANRATKKAAKSKPSQEAHGAPAPAEPPTQKPAPAKDNNHSSSLTEEMKLLRAELAQTRKEKRERQAAKKSEQEEAKAKAKTKSKAPPPEPAQASPEPTPIAPPAVQYYWCGRTGKRVPIRA